MKFQNESLTRYTAAFVDELVRSGVEHVVISPGSRSTPLAMLLAERQDVDVYIHVDERSASFFALGIAKVKKEPVAILCSSGTAAANYYPAVIEARLSRVPLIVLSADRPHELRDRGAPQTIDQVHLFGTYPKWFIDMALPEASGEMLRYARANAGRAATTAMAAPAGPVHVNMPYREPLTPDLTIPRLWNGGQDAGLTPRITAMTGGKRYAQEKTISRLADVLNNTEKGLFVCGPNADVSFIDALLQVAEWLRFPVLADPLSNLRTGEHDKQLIIDSYDAFLRDSEVVHQLEPDVVIRFGAMPISKSFLQYVQSNPSCRQIIIDEGEGWRDPSLGDAEFIYADADAFSRQLLHSVEEKNKANELAASWLKTWQKVNDVSRQHVWKESQFDDFFEGQVMRETIDMIPEKATLFVGNSMPVRDLDTFLWTQEKTITTMANRGANGIDGVVSSALGASTAGLPLVLVIGDLSFYHDLNGLLAAKWYRLNVTIIVLNNDGGGIFSFLPQAEQNNEHFESLFGTPVGLDYEDAVNMYGGSFERVQSWQGFRKSLKDSLLSPGMHVIEVTTDRKTNVDKHRGIWKRVREAVRELPGDDS